MAAKQFKRTSYHHKVVLTIWADVALDKLKSVENGRIIDRSPALLTMRATIPYLDSPLKFILEIITSTAPLLLQTKDQSHQITVTLLSSHISKASTCDATEVHWHTWHDAQCNSLYIFLKRNMKTVYEFDMFTLDYFLKFTWFSNHCIMFIFKISYGYSTYEILSSSQGVYPVMHFSLCTI